MARGSGGPRQPGGGRRISGPRDHDRAGRPGRAEPGRGRAGGPGKVSGGKFAGAPGDKPKGARGAKRPGGAGFGGKRATGEPGRGPRRDRDEAQGGRVYGQFRRDDRPRTGRNKDERAPDRRFVKTGKQRRLVEGDEPIGDESAREAPVREDRARGA
ncbi:hypothetical protein PQJ75_16880, partial [Rhodoplanes sp. TEM]|nr:hypothetical protein [Rhodoplanes sp. TEM]